jgi:hypothetical protein
MVSEMDKIELTGGGIIFGNVIRKLKHVMLVDVIYPKNIGTKSYHLDDVENIEYDVSIPSKYRTRKTRCKK